MPPSPSTSSSPGHEPGVATADGDGAVADDDGADGAGERDGADGDGDDGAEDGYRFADAYDESGRVASRPGFPLQSPLRSDFRCNPSRLRSLRSLRAPLARQLAALAAACRTDTFAATFDRIACVTAVSSSRRRSAPRSSRRLVVRRRCRLRRPPARPPPGASPAPLVRALLRSERAPCSASRRAVVPRTTPCSIRCTSRRSIAAPAPMNRLRRRRFPELRCCRLAVLDRPGRPWFSHPTHLWCTAHTAAHAASFSVSALTLHGPARPCRAGKRDTNLVVHPPAQDRVRSTTPCRPCLRARGRRLPLQLPNW